MKWIRSSTLTLIGMTLLTLSAPAGAGNGPQASLPSAPIAPLRPTTRQVAELVVTAGCVEKITVPHDVKIHLILDDHGKPNGQWYIEGSFDIDFIPVEARATAPNCDITHGVSRQPVNPLADVQ